MWVHDLRDADASCGGKAQNLGRLIAAGLAVPQGFVIDDRAFRSIVGELVLDDTANIGHVLAQAAERIATARIPPELEREVQSRVPELGHSLAVRSSATIEDASAGAAAGVFSSRGAVPVEELWEAIRFVWVSALTPLAAAYARKRGGTIAIGVIVQEYVSGTPFTVYTRPPGQPSSQEVLIQRADHVSRHSRDDMPREIEAQHAMVLALRAEQALGVEQGVDVEIVQIRKQSGFDVAIETVVVQARPIVHPTARTLVPPPPAVLAPLQDGRTWTWDVAHNPDPLSLAQQGLVERVESAGVSPYSLRLCSGFLYASPRGEEPPIARDPGELRTHTGELIDRLEKILDDRGDALPVAEAVERYLAFYAIWARELSPLVAAARAVLPNKLREHGSAFPEEITASLITRPASTVESTLYAAARGELDEDQVHARLGVLAPAWDVAARTFGETPGLLRHAIARAKSVPQPSGASVVAYPEEHRAEIEIAHLAADLAERDDVLFARAQWLVRRALLARGHALELRGDDVFWLPLDEVVNATSIDRDDAHRRASAARNAAERAAQWRMPLVVGGADPLEGTTDETDARPLKGIGTGPRVAGRVVRFASLASAVAVGAGDVVVTRAVTPALAVLVAGCAALVSESGGLLDHGAALARELGIPCVVGCRDAWTRLTNGMLVTVDGDGGTVTPLPATPTILVDESKS